MKSFYFLILPVLLTGCFGMAAREGYDMATDQRSVRKQIDDAGIRGQIEVQVMFVVLINFPAIKEGKDTEFREWFEWSNKEFINHKGFIRRLLLKSAQGGGNYVALVEHESRETFMAMHNSPAHEEAGKRVVLLLDGHPTPQFYEVVVGG